MNTNPGFRYEGATRVESNLVIFKVTPTKTTSMESSQRDVFSDMLVDRLIFNNNQITLSSCSPSYLKQGFVFTVLLCYT